jgi:nitroreductase
MDVFEAIQMRRSVRSYLPEQVPLNVLNRILEAGRLAPSANNRMPWNFIVVTDPQKRKAIADSGTYGKFLTECPVVIVGCGDRESAQKWHVVDTTIALENMVIAATAEGLGTCWIGSFDEKKVKDLLKVPDSYAVVALIALGYPKEKMDLIRLSMRLRPKKKLEQITSSEEFGRPLTFPTHEERQGSAP